MAIQLRETGAVFITGRDTTKIKHPASMFIPKVSFGVIDGSFGEDEI